MQSGMLYWKVGAAIISFAGGGKCTPWLPYKPSVLRKFWWRPIGRGRVGFVFIRIRHSLFFRSMTEETRQEQQQQTTDVDALKQLADKYMAEYERVSDNELIAASYAVMENVTARTQVAFMHAFEEARQKLQASRRSVEWSNLMLMLTEPEWDDFLNALRITNMRKSEQYARESEAYYCGPGIPPPLLEEEAEQEKREYYGGHDPYASYTRG